MASALTFTKSDTPAIDTLRLQQYPVPECKSGEVLIGIIGSPINPMDLHVIAGTYPVQPRHKIGSATIPGEDGAGRVLDASSDVKTLSPGDLVVPRLGGFGCWRSHAICREEELWKLPTCNDPRFACILRMTVLPAYFLLADLRQLKPGDWIIHNAGASSISQMLCQFAHHFGVRTISVFRNRRTFEEDTKTKSMLSAMGSTLPITESELGDDSLFAGKNVVLGLDAVWGESTEAMLQRISNGGTFGNYGILAAKSPSDSVRVRQSTLFAKGITLKGFRSSQCMSARSDSELEAVLHWAIGLSNRGLLRIPGLKEVGWPTSVGGPAEVALLQSVASARKPAPGSSKPLFIIDKAV